MISKYSREQALHVVIDGRLYRSDAVTFSTQSTAQNTCAENSLTHKIRHIDTTPHHTHETQAHSFCWSRIPAGGTNRVARARF